MRILFASLPTHGHTYPVIPLALAARDVGHDVLFATGESFHHCLAGFGLAAVPAGIGMPEAFVRAAGGTLGDRASITPERQAELVAEAFGNVLPRANAADLRPVLERVQPDLVVYESANRGAFFAAKLAGVPGICHGIGRAGFVDNHPIGERLQAFAAEVGVDFPIEKNRDGGDPYLDIYPASMQDKEFLKAGNRIPLKPVPVNEPGRLPAWLAARKRDRPLVYLTLGTVFGAIPVLRQAIDGLGALDVDVLVAAGPTIDVDALTEVPDRVRVEKWVPQAELLPQADLVVHHGGSGTTLGALANGLPQLVLPQGADQFSNAEVVTAAGAGDQLLGGDQSAEAVTAKVNHLLTGEEYRAAAKAVATEIAAMPSPEATVAVLPEIASGAGD
ncbi:MAG TPA: glycosyltransferase [Amycolatopsis sp.]|uniref:glycosyltransferase n=1 Tax=Amycolatopsis sp. TaxID=37632 RepID=UPI002B472C04|nr:glycosyltransferase [Amycolatopsis sp.]HKS47952.1 glycosyltransferase [Amycolatopsis sp.]